MKEQQVFITDDGKTFDTRSEAIAHETMIKHDAAIEQWIKDTYIKEDASEQGIKTAVTRHKKSILAWEAVRKDVLFSGDIPYENNPYIISILSVSNFCLC